MCGHFVRPQDGLTSLTNSAWSSLVTRFALFTAHSVPSAATPLYTWHDEPAPITLWGLKLEVASRIAANFISPLSCKVSAHDKLPNN